MKVEAAQFLLYVDGLEEGSLTFHVHIQARQFPVTGRDLGLLDFESPPRDPVIQQSTAEPNLVTEVYGDSMSLSCCRLTQMSPSIA